MRPFIIILIVLSIFTLLLPLPSGAATDVQVEQGQGFQQVATPSLTLSPGVPTLVGTLPAGTKNVYFLSYGDETLVGDASMTTVIFCGKVASGTGVSLKIDGIHTIKPAIYLMPAGITTTTLKITAWVE